MIDIAKQGEAGALVTMRQAAQRQGLSVKYLEQLGGALVRAGVLKSIRGVSGGYYLAKPADPEDLIHALLATGGERPEPPAEPMSADRVRWEHILRVYELCDRNVSETARRLKMHRRTLQRILAKRSPR